MSETESTTTATARNRARDVHVVSLPLKIRQSDRDALDRRLRAACALHNGVLQRAIERVKEMRDDPAWAAAAKTPRGSARTALFRTLRDHHGITQASLDKLARQLRDACWIGDHIGGHDAQTVAKRVLLSIEAWMFGKRGRPRFKPASRYRSIESKDGKSLMQIHQDEDGFPVLHFRGLALPIRRRVLDAETVASLALKIRQIRIVQRTDTARDRFEVQIVVEGKPPIRHEIGTGIVGVDVGPSTIAVVSDDDHLLRQIAPEVMQPWKQQRRTQRALDRSLRAANPDCFDAAGRWVKGKQAKNLSKGQRRLRRQHRRQEAALAATRRHGHNRLANHVLAVGRNLHLERLSYVAFQKTFGRSTKVRAAGQQVSTLIRKAENAGGSVTLIETRATRLSQFDHTTCDYVRKPLSQRAHALRDGSGTVQRDLYSAFLAMHCTRDTLDVASAQRAWTGACEHLATASGADQPARGVAGFPPPHVHQDVRAGRRETRITRHRGAERRPGETDPGRTMPKQNPSVRF